MVFWVLSLTRACTHTHTRRRCRSPSPRRWLTLSRCAPRSRTTPSSESLPRTRPRSARRCAPCARCCPPMAAMSARSPSRASCPWPSGTRCRGGVCACGLRVRASGATLGSGSRCGPTHQLTLPPFWFWAPLVMRLCRHLGDALAWSCAVQRELLALAWSDTGEQAVPHGSPAAPSSSMRASHLCHADVALPRPSPTQPAVLEWGECAEVRHSESNALLWRGLRVKVGIAYGVPASKAPLNTGARARACPPLRAPPPMPTCAPHRQLAAVP